MRRKSQHQIKTFPMSTPACLSVSLCLCLPHCRGTVNSKQRHRETVWLLSWQRDQMAGYFLQYLASCKNKNCHNSIKVGQIRFKSLQNTNQPSKICPKFCPRLSKFCPRLSKFCPRLSKFCQRG